jgi:hypothetical protein
VSAARTKLHPSPIDFRQLFISMRALWDAADALMLLVFFPQLGLFTWYHDMARMHATRGLLHDKDKLKSSDSADPVASIGSGTSDLRLSPSRLIIGTAARRRERSRARVPTAAATRSYI